MNKYIIIGDYVIGGSIVYLDLAFDQAAAVFNITVSYSDKQLLLSGASNFTSDDIELINGALVELWQQDYTKSTIDVTLSQPITSIA